MGESTPTEAEYEVPLPLVEVGVSRLDEKSPETMRFTASFRGFFFQSIITLSLLLLHRVPMHSLSKQRYAPFSYQACSAYSCH